MFLEARVNFIRNQLQTISDEKIEALTSTANQMAAEHWVRAVRYSNQSEVIYPSALHAIMIITELRRPIDLDSNSQILLFKISETK
jgi:hypothetical protein